MPADFLQSLNKQNSKRRQERTWFENWLSKCEEERT